jgi:hypothetical protein
MSHRCPLQTDQIVQSVIRIAALKMIGWRAALALPAIHHRVVERNLLALHRASIVLGMIASKIIESAQTVQWIATEETIKVDIHLLVLALSGPPTMAALEKFSHKDEGLPMPHSDHLVMISISKRALSLTRI